MTYHNSSSFLDALKRTNPIATSLIGLFGLIAFIQYNMMAHIVEFASREPWMPFLASMTVFVLIFVMSGTRDPSDYHPGESVSVMVYVLASALVTFSDRAADFLASHDPVSGAVMVLLGLVVAAVLSR